MKSIIIVIIYFLSTSFVFANGGEAGITVISEADWMGPFVAVLIIVATVVIAKTIKKRVDN